MQDSIESKKSVTLFIKRNQKLSTLACYVPVYKRIEVCKVTKSLPKL